MQKITDIDILGDKDVQLRVTRLSLAFLVVTLAAAALLAVCGALEHVDVGWWWVALALGVVVALPAHELVHGAAFKLLCPGCRVSFGFQDAFLYTKTDGAVAARGHMVAVLLAPAVLVTAALAAGALAFGCPVLAVLLAGVHLSGCAGDLLMSAAALNEPRCTHVVDTETGIALLSDVFEGA
ncbi:DUF3267 domain-containing protein [Thermophilibacter provencensis]|uniref:DUF3267 domain-containing protein n=1 Tax=Thermophilibacter provencensis TaxID=1852386 RepID=A0ABT7V3K3_9ACTN|nr:DUF3267 domain-containing protein [Thermophilibacter provencensis]MDM8271174.1 DUF3267 domain-containing protein [Thermophilibacter provencensis]